jgi:hypothetical protein
MPSSVTIQRPRQAAGSRAPALSCVLKTCSAPVGTVPGMRGREVKENGEGGKFNFDICGIL